MVSSTLRIKSVYKDCKDGVTFILIIPITYLPFGLEIWRAVKMTSTLREVEHELVPILSKWTEGNGTFVGNSYPTITSLFCQNHPMYTETTETYKYSRNLVAGIHIFFFLWVEFKSTLKHECCIAAKVLFQIVVIVI